MLLNGRRLTGENVQVGHKAKALRDLLNSVLNSLPVAPGFLQLPCKIAQSRHVRNGTPYRCWRTVVVLVHYTLMTS